MVSLFAASCLTPSFKLDDGGGVGTGGMGGAPPADHCKNSTLDPGETSTNCGGPDCEPCDIGLACVLDRDCKNKSCVNSVCADPTCSDGDKNQGETATDCGGPVCGATCQIGDSCLADADCESGACKSRECVESACNDNKQNSGETDVDCGGSICGATCDTGQRCRANSDCRQPDDTSKGTARCVDEDPNDDKDEKRCSLSCPIRTGDCNEMAKDGCETNTETSLEHCGGCGERCNPPNSVQPFCDAGSCKMDPSQGDDGCVTGYANCDGRIDNGCEINLRTDVKACGSCETVCSDQNGDPRCMAGVCAIECDDGFEDCDDEPGKNGCETNTQTDTRNCGGCGDTSAAYQCMGDPDAGIYPVCLEGECDTVDCSGYVGLADCDGDGQCDDSLTTTMNCGGCGVSCSVQDGIGSCEVDSGTGKASCAIYQCESNHANCDSDVSDCEVDIRSDDENCGGCASSGGLSCVALEDTSSLRVADSTCQNKKCVIHACDAGYADCDLNPENGCETNTAAAGTCGGCLPTSPAGGSGINCQTVFPNANVACSGGTTCTQTSCKTNYDDCESGGGANAGCETSVTTVDSCGSCDTVCGGDQNRVVGRSCTGPTTYACSVTCQAGYCPNSSPERACTVQLGQSINNCEVCGDTCGGTNPFCDSGSCMQRLSATMAQAVTGQATSGATATVSITVSSGSNRALVIAVAAGKGATLAIRYQGSLVTPVVSQGFSDGQPGAAAIAYVLESSLGGSGAKQVTVESDWGGKIVTVYQLNNVAQAAPVVGGTSTNTDCPHNLTRSVTVGSAGSFTVASHMAQSPSAVTASPTGLTETFESFQGDQVSGFMGTSSSGSNFTAGWSSLTGTCYGSALVTATFGPAIVPGP